MLDHPISGTRLFDVARIMPDALDPPENKRVRAAILDSICRDVSRPLAIILGAVAELKDRTDAAEGSVEAALADTIRCEAARLESYVSILLDMARLESGSAEQRMATVEVKTVVGKAVKDAAGALGDRQADMQLPADLPPLRVDPAMLRRVVFLLIDNAARQSPPGSTIGIHAGRDRTAIRIQVLDEGDGLPPAELGRLFDQYHLPGADDQAHPRAGMPLAVCRGYIEAMGGTISGSNRSDRSGAVFTIAFPVAA